jgi:uncharacterized membrane protein SpoIIM required for sporulation
MLEMIVNPRSAKLRPWGMFFIGLIYSLVSLAMVGFIFAKDTVLSNYGGILVVTFTVLFSLPFMYYLIKIEEGKDMEITDEGKLVREHWKAISALMWLFFGFVIGFSMWYIIFPSQNVVNFNAQIEIFCSINSPNEYSTCLQTNGLGTITGKASGVGTMLSIFSNNIYVLIFTIMFSLAFGAGALFILVWNASVIGAAIGMFAKSDISNLPLAVLRYMFHGLPEILAYFVAALAGGIVSVAIIRRDIEGYRKWNILQDALLLIIISVAILIISAFLEVFITPVIIGLF